MQIIKLAVLSVVIFNQNVFADTQADTKSKLPGASTRAQEEVVQEIPAEEQPAQWNNPVGDAENPDALLTEGSWIGRYAEGGVGRYHLLIKKSDFDRTSFVGALLNQRGHLVQLFVAQESQEGVYELFGYQNFYNTKESPSSLDETEQSIGFLSISYEGDRAKISLTPENDTSLPALEFKGKKSPYRWVAPTYGKFAKRGRVRTALRLQSVEDGAEMNATYVKGGRYRWVKSRGIYTLHERKTENKISYFDYSNIVNVGIFIQKDGKRPWFETIDTTYRKKRNQ